VLTPHLTAPLPEDGRRVDDEHVLSSGAYNLGFVAVGPHAHAFLGWWWGKTRRRALVDHRRMMFTDQRWIDLVPGLFDHALLKEPGWNAAYWNLHAREITFAEGRWLAGGQPLVFFHYSGYDPNRPHLLSYHQADRPRILLSERPDLARLCREYADKLRAAGLEAVSATPYGWARLDCGVAFDRRMRRIYRDALLASEQGLGPMPPSPFEGDGGAFLEWLREPVAPPLRPRVPRYLDAVWRDRADLQAAFPDLAGVDAHRFLVWVNGDGAVQERIAQPLLPDADAEALAATARPAFASPPELLQGLNVAGYLDAELGLGEAARLVTAAVEAAGIPHSTLAYHDTSSRRGHPLVLRGGARAPFDVNLVCVGPDRTPGFAREARPTFFAGRRTAALWFWELEELPAPMQRGFDVVDEVWAVSDFVARTLRAAGRRPVHSVLLPVPPPRCAPGLTRPALGLPEDFLFLFAFDFFRVLERKNPLGLVEAFCRAFEPGAGPRLLLKSVNGDARLDELERLRAAIAGRPDILLWDGYLGAHDKNALLALCDAYVSLHRSEGFGLTLAEAMALGKPVVATGYSGNLDFMTAENSYLVDWRPGRVPPGCDPYPPGYRWAEPDLEHAAACLRRVAEHPTEAALKAQRGRQEILSTRTPERAGAAIRERLKAAREDR
jgi:glycosyltransferase involved in cell wall biosynthesis